MRAYYRRDPQKIRDISLASRNRRIEKVREADRVRGFHCADPVKNHARRALNHAIDAGRLIRGCCEVCGAPNAEGHHEDYSRPLEVRWLCRPHHAEIHRSIP